jgi:YD repeat-containing protein
LLASHTLRQPRHYGYDNPGRLTSATFGTSAPGIFNAWDALGRLTSTTSTTAVGSSSETFGYDGNGNLISDTIPAGTTTYNGRRI